MPDPTLTNPFPTGPILPSCRDGALWRIRASNPEINAVVDIAPPRPLRDGPLSGLCLGVKSNIAVESVPRTGGILAYAGDVAGRDAAVVSRLREAGADIVASLNMEEGALGATTDNPVFGRTQNPLRIGHTPGGSSGGSAAAVAAGYVNAALGTDTMGSVRIPSAYCGLWGFKPSHDRDMLDGVLPLSPTLDTVGVHAADPDTLIAVTEVICGRSFAGGQAKEVHLLDASGEVELDPAVAAAYRDFTAKVGPLPGVRLAPYAFGRSRRAGLILSEVEGFAVHAERLRSSPEGFSDAFRGLLDYGRDLDLDRIDAAYAHLTELRQADFPDVILMPTAPQTAFAFGSPVPANQADFTAFANLADRPAIQFPIGVADGLPVGAQLVGARGREADLVATLVQFLGGSVS